MNVKLSVRERCLNALIDAPLHVDKRVCEALDEADDRIATLTKALVEIARVKRGGIEANDSDEEWIEFWSKRCSKYEALAREALKGNSK